MNRRMEPRSDVRRLAAIVGQNILTARAEAGMTQRTVTETIGVSSMLVSNWERGTARPSDENLIALSDLFGRDIAWFFTDHERAAA